MHDMGVKELYRFDELIRLGLSIIKGMNDKFADPRRSDVQQLAMRLVTQALTIYRLGQNPDLGIPRLLTTELTFDLTSIAVIFRTVYETYSNMFEVFFEPITDDEFEFQHALWILSGIVILENYELGEEADIDESVRNYREQRDISSISSEHLDFANKLINETRDRITNTAKFRALAKEKDGKNKQNKILKGKSVRSVKEVAKADGFGTSFVETIYSYYSGYIHADGYTSQQITVMDKRTMDVAMDYIMLMTMILMSKMILHYANKFPEARMICESDEQAYGLAQHLSKMAD